MAWDCLTSGQGEPRRLRASPKLRVEFSYRQSVTINLAPADVRRKVGIRSPMALDWWAARDSFSANNWTKMMFLGELSAGWECASVHGAAFGGAPARSSG